MTTDAIALAGLRSATLSADGTTVGLTFQDLGGDEHRFVIAREALGQLFVRLLAVAAKAKNLAQDLAPETPDPTALAEVLLPFPIAHYTLGLSEDRSKVALRVVSDNDLVWDFLLPLDGIERLRADLARIQELAAAPR